MASRTQRMTHLRVKGQEVGLWITFDDVTLDVTEVRVDAVGLTDFDASLRFKGVRLPKWSGESRTFDVTGLKVVRVTNPRTGGDAYNLDFDARLDVLRK